VVLGSPAPANSPVAESGLGSNGVGQRAIPTQQGTVLQRVRVPAGEFSGFLDEDWGVSLYLSHPDGRQLAYTSPGLETFEAPRIDDAGLGDGLRRSIDMCYQGVRPDGSVTDDPRSPFNGCNRNTYFGLNQLANGGGPNVWYTDPYGRQGSRSWFPGSVRQWLASADVDGSSLPFALEAEAVRAPN
jgi:hypothetical protein